MLELPEPTQDLVQPQDLLGSRSAPDRTTPEGGLQSSTYLGTSTSEEHETETLPQVFGDPSDRLHQVGTPVYEQIQREEEEEELDDCEDIGVARQRQLAGKKEEEEDEDEFKSSYVAKNEIPGDELSPSQADIVTASVSSPPCNRNEGISSGEDLLRAIRRKRLLY